MVLKKPKYYFFLNPYNDYKWTKCPKCDRKTKLRKYCLMIHYEEKTLDFHQLISLNKSCKFCSVCELVIVHKSEIEDNLKDIIPNFSLRFNPDNYFVFGTMDRKDWKMSQKTPMEQSKALGMVTPFKNTWVFEIRPGGWYREDEE